MATCDVLIAGGGPAGSTCAWALRQAGLDVVVVDKALFPRDKVCAGWITPQVVTELRLDADDYRRGRTFQPFTGFRVGLIGDGGYVETAYDHAISFGIRRSEFDDYLLRRTDARLRLGTPISSLSRNGSLWTVNESLTAPMLVGAGGHFCPVARELSGSSDAAALVVAQEAEIAIDPRERSSFTTLPGRPELYFSRTLDGYGWCLRKQDYVNIGFGRVERHGLPHALAQFVELLKAEGKIPRRMSCRWKGHAYLLSGPSRRRVVDDGVLLVGDAAGLASPHSGEGIRSAVESGLMAAATIVEAQGEYAFERLRPYEDRLTERFGVGKATSVMAQAVRGRIVRTLGRWLLRRPEFVRHVVLDRWFLHAGERTLPLEH